VGDQSHGSERLSAMVRMAKSDHELWSEYHDFDKDPYLLNFTNGTVDLRTSTLRAHDPEDMISCLVPHTYDPYAQAPLWERLICRCTQCDGSGQTAEYLLRVLGYMVVGSNIEQKLPLIIGERRTGKSKIVEICARLLGPDYAVISVERCMSASWRMRWPTVTRSRRTRGISTALTSPNSDAARLGSNGVVDSWQDLA
jgi:putative DNA primase/helicase